MITLTEEEFLAVMLYVSLMAVLLPTLEKLNLVPAAISNQIMADTPTLYKLMEKAQAIQDRINSAGSTNDKAN